MPLKTSNDGNAERIKNASFIVIEFFVYGVVISLPLGTEMRQGKIIIVKCLFAFLWKTRPDLHNSLRKTQYKGRPILFMQKMQWDRKLSIPMCLLVTFQYSWQKIKVTDDWIWTVDLWGRKQSLDELCRNHCIISIQIVEIFLS